MNYYTVCTAYVCIHESFHSRKYLYPQLLTTAISCRFLPIPARKNLRTEKKSSYGMIICRGLLRYHKYRYNNSQNFRSTFDCVVFVRLMCHFMVLLCEWRTSPSDTLHPCFCRYVAAYARLFGCWRGTRSAGARNSRSRSTVTFEGSSRGMSWKCVFRFADARALEHGWCLEMNSVRDSDYVSSSQDL